jgi:hypothetical protein
MIEIDNKLVAQELFKKKFVCDLSACKGACCIEGDAGAPVTQKEIAIIESDLEKIKPYMRSEGIEAIEREGVAYEDFDGQMVTTLINEKECAFVYFDQNGITKCSIEKANRENKTEFLKPISCHLYPIRVKELKFYDSLNYDEWDICEPACACGSELNVPVYKFLKEPIIRKYGSDFFDKLNIVATEFLKQ